MEPTLRQFVYKIDNQPYLRPILGFYVALQRRPTLGQPKGFKHFSFRETQGQ